MIWTRRGLWPSVAIVAASTTVALGAQAQVGAGVLTGRLEDGATRQPVADAVVTVTSPALQGEQIVVTDSTGLYRIPNLPPGTYNLRVEKEAYRPYTRPNIGLRSDSTIRIDATLLPEALKAEEVVVVAQAPTVDVGSSSQGQSVNQEFTSRIAVSPVLGKGGGVRSFESVAEVTPGAKADGYGVSINGTTSPENAYVVDGLSVSNPAFGTSGSPLSIEFTREVNVISGGYMPEYGRSTGGTLNVVTKQGSNEFHGSLWANTSPGAFEGRRKRIRNADSAIEGLSRLSHVGDIGFDIGGPIVKDKLWFYAGFMVAETKFNLDRTINARELEPDPTPGAAPGSTRVVMDEAGAKGPNGKPIYPVTREVKRQTYQASRRDIQAFGKLTYTINEQNRLQLSLAALPSTSGGNGNFAINGAQGIPEVGSGGRINGQYTANATNQVANAYDASLKWTTESTNKKFLVDTTVGMHIQTDATRAADGQKLGGSGLADKPFSSNGLLHSITEFEDVPGCPTSADVDANFALTGRRVCPVRSYSVGGPGQLFERAIERYQAKTVFTYLAEGLGHHVAKAGADVEYMSYTSFRGYSGTRSLREDSTSWIDSRNYAYLTGPDTEVHLESLKWTTKTVIAGGFIQDSWSIMDKVTLNAGLRYDSQLMYGGDGALAMSLPNQWSPRLGVIYDPTQSGRSKVYVNYAKYYESVPLNLMDRAGSLEPSAYTSRPKPACDPRFIGEIDPATGTENPRGAACGNPATYSNTPLIVGQGAGQPAAFPDKKYALSGTSKTSIIQDLAPQSSSEVAAGAELDIVKNGRVGLQYVKRWMDKVIEDSSRDEAQTYLIGNPGYGLLRDFPKPTRNYDGLTVFFTKNLADDWMAQLSYTVSYLRGNYAGLYRPETLQLDPNINSDFDLRSAMVNRNGRLPGDRTHDIKLFGAKDWFFGENIYMNTGLSLRAQSGAPTNVLGAHPIYGNDEIFILPRGAGDELPWQFRVDPKITFGWKWNREQTVSVSLDIINLFNFQAATNLDQRYAPLPSVVRPIANGTTGNLPTNGGGPLINADGTPFDPATDVNKNFGQPLTYQTPRQFRIGIRTTF